jgi:phage terminase small subunit
MSKLSDKHEMFCQEYMINGFNATKAYISVYKVSDKVAEASSSRLFGNVKIKTRLDELKKETQKYYKITKEELLNDLKDIKDRNKGLRDQTAMKAIEIISKMSGFDAPIKQDITISEEPPLFSDDDLVD